MRKLVLAIIFAMLVLPLISASDVAYVVKYNADPVLTDILDEMGYSYDVITASEVSDTDFGNYSLLLLGRDRVANVPVNQYKSLILNTEYNEGWSQWVGAESSTQPLKINVSNPSCYTGDVSGEVQIYTSARFNGISIPVYYLQGKKTSVYKIASTRNNNNDYVIAMKDDPKRIFFGAVFYEYWTEDAETMFKGAVECLIEGEKENHAPVLDSEIPDLYWFSGENVTLDLSEYFSDPDGDELSYGVRATSSNQQIQGYINGSIVYLTSTPGWTGEDWIKFYASDGKLETDSNRLNLYVTDHAPILRAIGNKQVNEGQRLEFEVSAFDPDGGSVVLIAENVPQSASFRDNGDGTGIFEWQTGYEDAGTYSVRFVVRDNESLEDSEIVSINVKDVKQPPKFSDVKLCKNITPELEITIREPDDGDEFELGDKIDGEVRFKNRADEDMRVEYEVHLYDLDEDESLEDLDDDVDVDEGDSEEGEFEFEVPDDIEDNQYAILVIAEADEDQEYCNYAYVEIEIERPDDLVIIDEIKLIPDSVKQGGFMNVEVTAKNLGSDDQEAVIGIEVEDLDIDMRSEEFEIEEYDDDDEVTTYFRVEIPKNAEEKIYSLKATVYYSDEEDSDSAEFRVEKRLDGGVVILPIIDLTKDDKVTGTPIKLNGNDGGKIILTGATTSGDKIILKDKATETKKTVIISGDETERADETELRVSLSEREPVLRESKIDANEVFSLFYFYQSKASWPIFLITFGLVVGILILFAAIIVSLLRR